MSLKLIFTTFLVFACIKGTYSQGNITYSDRAYNIEMQKLDIERSKLRQQWITSGFTLATIIISVLVAFATYISNNKNALAALRMQSKIKVIDVANSAPGNWAANERIKLVNQILGEDLINENEIEITGLGQGQDNNRKEFIKMIIENFEKRREVIDLWKISFGKSIENDILEIEKHLFPNSPANEAS